MGRAARAIRARYVGFILDDSCLIWLTECTDYLLQAYENCPEDPVTCMSLAIASLARAMQRQADNRHHMIAQVGPTLSVVKSNSELLPGSSVHVTI